jgi:hypothetical protein
MAWVRERTIPTELTSFAGEVNVNFCGWYFCADRFKNIYSQFNDIPSDLFRSL